MPPGPFSCRLGEAAPAYRVPVRRRRPVPGRLRTTLLRTTHSRHGGSMPIHLGANAWIWTSPFTTSDPESLGLIDKSKQMGFETFEFGLEDPAHVDPAKLKERIQANGLRLVVCGAFGPDRDLTNDDAGVRDNSLNYITRAIEICEKAGCPT